MKQLTLIDKAFLLKKFSIFSVLDIDLLLTIADKMELERYKKGEPIFSVGQEGHRAYLIVEGEVRIQKGDEKHAILFPFDFFGEESILSEKPRRYSAVSEGDSVLLSLGSSHLHAILVECPTVASSLLEAYANSVEFRGR